MAKNQGVPTLRSEGSIFALLLLFNFPHQVVFSKVTGGKMIVNAFFGFCLWSQMSEALNNNLVLTPPMGWSSWGRFRCNVNCRRFPNECISEWLFREMAYKMVTDGYRSAGYEYIMMDDCWLANTRDRNGHLQPDIRRFPSGIKNLSDYVHSLGLKFGIYEDCGRKTCAGYPGILPYTMRRDVSTFISWGVDYVKIDGCYADPLDMPDSFGKLGRLLLSTGKPMVYSCSWPSYQQEIGMTPNLTEAALMCNSWRLYRDIQDSWHSVRIIMNYFGEHQEEFTKFAGPGHWNDPDALIIGNYGLSFEQAKVQMAIWAILAAPLVMSHDLRNVQPEFRNILLNPLLISINQDPMGIQGRRVFINRIKKYEVWTRPVMPFCQDIVSWALAVVNLDDGGEPREILVPLKYTELSEPLEIYTFIDLFDPKEEVEFPRRRVLLTRIPPLGVRMYKAELNVAQNDDICNRNNS